MTLEENVLAYLDGSLGDAESAELLHTLSASPDKRAVLDELQTGIECTTGLFMMLVPRRKCGDHDAGIRRLQRRTRSSVSRT